jgi:hypothetical protein
LYNGDKINFLSSVFEINLSKRLSRSYKPYSFLNSYFFSKAVTYIFPTMRKTLWRRTSIDVHISFFNIYWHNITLFFNINIFII